MLPSSLHDLADIAGLHGQPALAARLYGAAEALAESYECDLLAEPFAEECLREIAVAREQLDPDTFDVEWPPVAPSPSRTPSHRL